MRTTGGARAARGPGPGGEPAPGAPAAPERILALQRAAGNAAVGHLLARYSSLVHPGVLDNGIVTEAHTTITGSRATHLPRGTYVEVERLLPSGEMEVRAWSGLGGRRVRIPQSIFRRQPQIDDRRDDREERIGGTRDDVRFQQLPATLPLWDPATGPRMDDVHQGLVGSCYLMSAAAGLALTNPQRVRDLFPDPRPGQSSYVVSLHRPAVPGTPPTGQRWPIVVDLWIPREIVPRSADVGRFTASLGFGPSGTVFLWPFLLEKAMAVAIGGWDDLGEGGEPERENLIFGLLTGRTALRDIDWRANHRHRAGTGDWRRMSDAELLETLRARLADGDVVTASVIGPFARLPHNLIRNHAYTVAAVDVAARTISLRNPWGHEHPDPLSPEAFRQWVRWVTYGDFGGVGR